MEKCKTKMIPKLTEHLEKARMKGAKEWLKILLKKAKDTNNLKGALKHATSATRPKNKTEKQRRWRDLTKLFCNPGCLGTLYEEDIDFEKYVNDLCKEWGGSCKDKKRLIEEYKNTRKDIMKGSKTVLGKDRFYHAFDNKTKKRLIKDGALSGCTLGIHVL